MKIRLLIIVALLLVGIAAYWRGTLHSDDATRLVEVAMEKPAAESLPIFELSEFDSELTPSQPEFDNASIPALTPASNGPLPFNRFEIRGKVIDKRSGAGVPGVTVYAMLWDNYFNQNMMSPDLKIPLKVISDADGSFQIPKVREGIYGLMIYHDSFVLDQNAYKHTVDGTYPEDALLKLEPGGVVFGTITKEGKPIPHQPVTLHYQRSGIDPVKTSSDENGQFIFEGLMDASITVRATYGEQKRGMNALTRRGKATIVDILFSDSPSGISGEIYPFDLTKEYTVTAKNPDGKNFDAVVYADGAYTFDQLSPADYRITVQAIKWGRPVSRYDAIVRTKANSISFCDFFVCDISNVSGNVSNQRQNEDLEVYAVKSTMVPELNAAVFNKLRKLPLATAAEFDDNGSFFFPDLQAGYYTLIARGQGERMSCAVLEVRDEYPSPALFYEGDVAVLQLDDSWTHIAKEVQPNDSAGLQ